MSIDDFEHAAAVAHDNGAEQAVLGVLFSSPDAAAEVRRQIALSDFYLPAHQMIFAAACRLDDRHDPVEPAAVVSELTSTGEIRRIPGGAAYLADVYGSAPPLASLSHYARIVRDAATRRSLATVGVQMQQMSAIDGQATPAQIVEQMRSTLDELAVERLGSDVPLVGEVLPVALDEIEQLSKHGAVLGVPTGFVDLDKALNGLGPGQMITIAARPGVGKSALAMDCARHAAFRQGKSVMVFSLEMGAAELVMRMLSAEAYIDGNSIRTGDMDEIKWQQLAKATAKMQNAKLAIDDTATITLPEIRAKARAFQRAHGLDLIVVDYLQLMNSDRKTDSRQQEVSDLSRGMKLLAKEFKVPVLVLSQLNRGSEQRSDKKPVISDLRESGSIEQDSDVVILIHREEMYDKESPRAGEADIIIAKQRSGPTSTVVLSWLGKYARFADRALD